MKLIIVLSIFLACNYNPITAPISIDLEQKWCSACDDPHMHTSDGQNYEFQYAGDNYIMYTNYNNIRVTASFRKCNSGLQQPTCNCGMKVKYGSAYIILDVCQILAFPANMQFFYLDPPSVPNPIPANCASKSVPAGQETNDAWWDVANNAVNLGGKILCAKSAQLYNTYLIRTNDPNANENIYVKVMLHDIGISCLYVRPSQNSFNNNAGGLCGNFNNDPNDDKFTWFSIGPSNGSPNDGYAQNSASESDLRDFWHLEVSPPTGLGYKALESEDCPCDTTPTTNDTCVVILSECLSNSVGQTNITYSDAVHNYRGGQGGDIGKLQEEAAVRKCVRGLAEQKLDQAVNAGLLPQADFDDLKRMCILDQMATNGNLWLINIAQVGKNWVLEECVNQSHPLCAEMATPAKCSDPNYALLFPSGNFEPCPRQTCVKK